MNRTTRSKAKPSAADRSVEVRRGDVLLLVDVLTDLEFPGGEKVFPWARQAAIRLGRLRRLARAHRVPIVFANDNFGLWSSGPDAVFLHCTRGRTKGRAFCRPLRPGREDYFIVKPRHSAFFSTALRPLLDDLDARRLLIAGIATNLCVLTTAHDAHMHGYPMVVLSDCCAAETDFDHNIMLRQLERYFHATICTSDELRFTRRRRGVAK